MGIFRNDNEAGYVGGRKHFRDVIKNSGDRSLVIWRAPEEDFNDGSTLIVMPGEAALFLNGGRVEEVFREPGTYTLSSENYPFLSRLRNMMTGGVSAYNCVVYFVRMADSAEIRWGTTSPLQVRDKVLGLSTKIVSHGSYRVVVRDPELLLTRLVGNGVSLEAQEGLEKYFLDEFQGLIRATVTEELVNRDTEFLGIEEGLVSLSNRLRPKISEALRDYGMECVSFNVAALDIVDNGLRDEYDRISIDNIRKLSDYRTEGLAIDELGPRWAAIQQARILQKSAENPAGPGPTGDLASIVAGASAMVPMMQDAMGVSGVVPGSFGWVASGAAGQTPVQPETSRRYTQVSEDSVPAQATDAAERRARLLELKSYFEDGLISEEEFTRMKKEVLDQLGAS